ncbi:hypothetical protein JZ751_009579 [Albula glossodonta]|uniref:Uncharacterized protein n=1 Tax=Albula glossodonta TaxID=121402 RepID=A0A8T2P661_9TELE|nr:hypothetical protein JZ751_009579 [Albula glossodonta]
MEVCSSAALAVLFQELRCDCGLWYGCFSQQLKMDMFVFCGLPRLSVTPIQGGTQRAELEDGGQSERFTLSAAASLPSPPERRIHRSSLPQRGGPIKKGLKQNRNDLKPIRAACQY